MTIIDTSAWIEFFRKKGSLEYKSRVAELISARTAAYTCPIRYELFLGARPEEVPMLEQGLGFSVRITTNESHWDKAARCGAALRAKGLNFPSLDILIAAVAHSEKVPLLAKDAHFETIRQHVLPELKLLLLI